MTTWITTAFSVNEDNGFGILQEGKSVKVILSKVSVIFYFFSNKCIWHK
jgi:hypothetical protein